jgi:hypothetical protein
MGGNELIGLMLDTLGWLAAGTINQSPQGFIGSVGTTSAGLTEPAGDFIARLHGELFLSANRRDRQLPETEAMTIHALTCYRASIELKRESREIRSGISIIGFLLFVLTGQVISRVRAGKLAAKKWSRKFGSFR